MSARTPRAAIVALAVCGLAALPAAASAGPAAPSARLAATVHVQPKIVPVVAGDGTLWLCRDTDWTCIPW